MPRKDINQIAFGILRQATGEVAKPTKTARQTNSAKGGLKGGVVRASKLPPARRSEIAKKAAQGRWGKV